LSQAAGIKIQPPQLLLLATVLAMLRLPLLPHVVIL